MEKRHRIFIAINLPEDVKKELFLFSEKYADLPAKWTKKDNLHITLEFLGALTDQEIGDVCVAVKEVASQSNCFGLSINKIIYGPPNPPSSKTSARQGKMPPKFVWAEGEKSQELSKLRESLEKALTEKVSFIPENRIFAPHITLARIGAWEFKAIEPEERPEINENIDLIFTVESIEVMESEMRRGGPIYTILESHSLI